MVEPCPTKKELKALVSETKDRMVKMSIHYGLPANEIPERNLAKLSLVLSSKSYDEARDLAAKAYDSMFVCVLSMWAKKEIPGPTTPESLEKKAKQAEGLARMLENKGGDDAAKKQRLKAGCFLKEADALRQSNYSQENR